MKLERRKPVVCLDRMRTEMNAFLAKQIGSQWSFVAGVMAILLLAAGVRVAFLSSSLDQPDLALPSLDADYHHYWASALVSGDWKPPRGEADPLIRQTPFFRPPGYPYWLAAVYGVFGPKVLAAKIAQAVMGMLSLLLVILLARRFLDQKTALLAGLAMALYWAFPYFEGELLDATPSVLLTLLALYLLALLQDRDSLPVALAAGAALGASALIRPNVLVFAIAATGWLVWIGHTQRRGGRTIALSVGALVLGLAILIAPSAIRNFRVANEWVPISTNGGINFQIGNNATSNGYTATSSLIGRWNCYEYPKVVSRLEQRLGIPLTHSEASTYLFRQGLDYLVEHPQQSIELLVRKALLFWGPLEVSNQRVDELVRAESPVLSRLPLAFPQIFGLALFGLVVFAWRGGQLHGPEERRRLSGFVALGLLFVLSYFLSYLPFLIAGRYRLVIVPLLIIAASYGIVRYGELLVRQGFTRANGMLLAVAGALLILASQNFAAYRVNPADHRYVKANADFQFARYESAVAHFRSVLEADPAYPQLEEVLTKMGYALQVSGRYAEAAENYRILLRLRPDHANGYHGLAGSLYFLGQYPSALAALEQSIRLGAQPSRRMIDSIRERAAADH